MRIRQHLQHVGSVLGGLLLLGSVWGASADAATYYLSPTGADANAGTQSAPWKTFNFAIPKLRPGDTLVLRNGTYTGANSGYSFINCHINASNGTADQPITVKAESERRAFIRGDGTGTPLMIRNCAHWTIVGLYLRGGDFQDSSVGAPVTVRDSHDVTARRLLVTHNNRYRNSHLLTIQDSHNILVEESEFYSFQRHALHVHYTTNSIFRRNYFNSRGHDDLPGGFVSEQPDRGEMAITLYPGSNNIVENNISEGNTGLADIQATSTADNNQFLGNIALNNIYGLVIKARGDSGAQMPHNTTIKHFVAINPEWNGLSARSAKNTRCENCSVFGGERGIVGDCDANYPGDGTYSLYIDNTLVVNASTYGIKMVDQDAWQVAYSNAYGSNINFSPGKDPRFTNELSVNPQLGTCKVWIPATSPMKGAGKNGADIGASVLYRYVDGALTAQPLWEPGTGKFPCGAVVAGVNDLAKSCRDVHQRLNVHANGCLLPSDYGQQSLTVSSPNNFRVLADQ